MQLGTKYRKAPYIWLMAAFSLGLLLRWSFVFPVSWIQYKFLVHAHSHLALLGWVYGGFFTLILSLFIPAKDSRRFNHLFWWMQVSLVGMLISFPLQGYAASSITFSTIFGVTTYIFSWWVFRRLQGNHDVSAQFLRHALLFLVVSSLGPYGLGYFKAMGLKSTHWFPNSIYFYLHFLYNGFFLWALGAWACKRLEQKGIPLSISKVEINLLSLSTWLTFCLSVLWMEPSWSWYVGGIIGSILQLWILGKWLIIKSGKIMEQAELNSASRWIALFIGGIILIKLISQILSAYPAVTAWIHSAPMFTVIGYIHLIMLGILTPFLLVNLSPQILNQPWFKRTAFIYLFGFGFTEMMLFGHGLWPELGTKINFFPLLLTGYLILASAVLRIVWYILLNSKMRETTTD